MFTKSEHAVLFCTVIRSDVNTLRAVVSDVDPNAFIVIGQGHQASGGVLRQTSIVQHKGRTPQEDSHTSYTKSHARTPLQMNNKRIQELEEQIEDLKNRWPPHSVPAALLNELDDLEEALAAELEKTKQRGKLNA
ncbi:MAG: DUF2179 domain-containing protein [Chloroflexi bacterium]|nr:DUF2179 domain-containing protein [Chloroflexota bacterium]